MAYAQPAGLAGALNWGDHGGDRLFFTALATSAAAGPLTAVLYRAKGIQLGRIAAVAAGPVAVYAFQPSRFTARASAPAVDAADVTEASDLEPTKQPELRQVSLRSLYHPLSLLKLLAKNVGMAGILLLNQWMLQVFQHEQDALVAEAQGQPVPPLPPIPDVRPSLERGLRSAGRELAVSTVRLSYERMVSRRLPPHRAQAFLRDGRQWARDVLAKKLHAAPVSRRFSSYFFATLHSSALLWAADCTVSVAQHTYHTIQTKRQQPRLSTLKYWAKGVGLQVTRCALMLIAGAIGASLGSLVQPGNGTYIGQHLTEGFSSYELGKAVTVLLEDH